MGHRTGQSERGAWWPSDSELLGSPVTALDIARQGSRRHPWRKSRPLQAGASAAPGWRGGGVESAASVPSRCHTSYRSCGGLGFARQQKAPSGQE
jgi:hypothetical protein